MQALHRELLPVPVLPMKQRRTSVSPPFNFSSNTWRSEESTGYG